RLNFEFTTQYLLNGQCCLKCKPGTSMQTNMCTNPVCKECDENEYMDKYNTEPLCERQPYCDPNQNFEFPKSTSKTKRFTCLCREGFHCSSQTCLTCVAHTECEPGYGAKTTGGQTRDTQCEKCPDGTFSDEKSWNSTCKKMTECQSGYDPQGGSSESDNLCGKLLFVFTMSHLYDLLTRSNKQTSWLIRALSMI
uniref:TNFR-Cys domain-containing protein n=1 Tax=Periophthalmus magnuspinnatus TaxID=409849 RepID=A0A3B4BBF1_9GOBI